MNDTNMDAVQEDHILSLFDTTPEKFPWNEQKVQEIERRRIGMTDMLIFDTLLVHAGIRDPHTLYPPTDKRTLQILLDAIGESKFDTLKRDNLVYYLLKWYEDGRDVAFKERHNLPPHFTAVADAYWLLDAGRELPRAISILADARLRREWPSKILQAISLDPKPYPLVRKYVKTVYPALQQPEDLDLYIIALAESSLLEAWQYQATFPEESEIRERLIHRILYWCLFPKPRVTPLTQLLAFPLQPYEQNLIEQYALEPPFELPVNSLPALQDLACTRLVQGGQYAAAIKLDRQFSVKTGDTYRRVAEGRRQLMDEILAVMPPIERMLLEEELERTGHGSQVTASLTSDSLAWTPPDLSMSWEVVRPAAPSASTPAKRAPRTSDVFMEQPIPQRSGAPRFGGPIPDLPAPVQTISPSRGASTRVTAAKSPSVAATGLSQSMSGAGRVPQTNVSAQGPSAPMGSVRSKISLFESVGSANKARTAFYEPPVSADMKHSFGQDIARSPEHESMSAHVVQADASIISMSAEDEASQRESTPEQDVEMQDELMALVEEQREAGETTSEPSHRDLSEGPSLQASEQPDQGSRLDLSNEIGPEPESFSFSVFKKSLYMPPEDDLATSKRGGLPGAYEPEVEEPESPVSPAPTTRSTRHSKAELQPKTPKKRARDSTEHPEAQPGPGIQTRASARQRMSKIPKRVQKKNGSISSMTDVTDTHDDDEKRAKKEEEDVVPPLPSISMASSGISRRTRRTSREVEEEKPVRATRRSSRLSTQQSLSPETKLEVSPVKKTRSRTSTTATPRKTRRQR